MPEGKVKFGKIKRVPPEVKSNVKKAAGKGASAAAAHAHQRLGRARPVGQRSRRRMRTT